MHPLSAREGNTSTVGTSHARGSSSPPVSQHLSGNGSAVARFGGYGGLAVTAWLLTALATGSGIAFADDAASTDAPSSTSTSAAGPRTKAASRSETDSATDAASPSSKTSSASRAESGDEPTRAPRRTKSAVGATDDTEEVTDTEADSGSVPVPTTPAQDVSQTPADSGDPAPEQHDTDAQGSTPNAVTAPSNTALGSASKRQTEKADRSPSSSITAGDDAITASLDAIQVRAAAGAVTAKTPTHQASTSRVTSPLPTPASVAVRDAIASTKPRGVIARIVNRVLEVVFKPLIDAAPPVPSGQSPFAWAVLAFVRRNFFNDSPVITATNVAAQQNADGLITGNIDAVDPDELGKTVQVRASVWAGAAVPTDCGCAPEPGLLGLSFTNPAILGQDPGDNWRAPAAVDNTCAYLNPEDFSVVFYRGTETGEVTIDGLGTGNVVLDFTGTLTEGGASERSVATLVPELGTGALKGVTGTVTSESSFNPDGSLNGVLTGTVVRPELRYVIVGKPKHGTVTVDKLTGAFTYTPDPEFASQGGADSFRVVVTDKRFNLLNLFKRYNGDPVHTIDLNVSPIPL